MKAAEIYAKLDGPRKCALLDCCDEDDPSLPSPWMHDLGLADADADYQGEETGYVDGSTINELGDEVAALCKIWHDARVEISLGLHAMLNDSETELADTLKQCVGGSKMATEATAKATHEQRVLKAVLGGVNMLKI